MNKKKYISPHTRCEYWVITAVHTRSGRDSEHPAPRFSRLCHSQRNFNDALQTWQLLRQQRVAQHVFSVHTHVINTYSTAYLPVSDSVASNGEKNDDSSGERKNKVRDRILPPWSSGPWAWCGWGKAKWTYSSAASSPYRFRLQIDITTPTTTISLVSLRSP